MNLIKKYWDIFGGIIMGLGLSLVAKFKLEKIQLYYSIIILILVSIGVLKIVRQTMENNKKKRKENVIDKMVDSQKPIKAVNLAQYPTKEGEKLGKLIIETWRYIKRTMQKIKEFLCKFKGYLLTAILTILSLVEMYGGFMNDVLGDKLVINGVNILSLITLVCAIIVGCLSNGYTKEQIMKIKALFSKDSASELVITEIKKTIKEDEAKLKEFNKILASQETALDNLGTELINVKNVYAAKLQMAQMVPPLATNEDVSLAAAKVNEVEANIVKKRNEIAETNAHIQALTTTINALKNRLC